jgi:hypothetical protein
MISKLFKVSIISITHFTNLHLTLSMLLIKPAFFQIPASRLKSRSGTVGCAWKSQLLKKLRQECRSPGVQDPLYQCSETQFKTVTKKTRDQ